MNSWPCVAVSLVAVFLFQPPIEGENSFIEDPIMTKSFLDACARGDIETVEKMLGEDAELAGSKDDNGQSAVLKAVYHGQPRVARALIATGLELDVFEAAAAGRTERLRRLIAEDPTLLDAYAPDGFFPLGLAVFFGHADTVDALLEAGARVNLHSREAMRVTPLHSAVAANRIDIGRKLIERGADVNAVSSGGHTPLHETAARGNIEFSALLLEHGAEINAKMNDGKTPLALALERKQETMAEFLRDHGAQP